MSSGVHTFQVRATDPAGNLDPTPASFTWTIEEPTAELTVTITVIGRGVVNTDPPQATYQLGDFIELTAMSERNHFFVGWSGDYVGTDTTISLIVTGNINIIATFSQYELLLPIVMN